MKHAQTVLFPGDGMAGEPLAELGGRTPVPVAVYQPGEASDAVVVVK